jgi:hypothetical protein
MRWTTDLSIAHLEDRVQMALQVGVASASFFVRPAWMTIGRPRIVTEILTDYPCWIGTRPILPHKQIIEASDVPDFVNDILLDPGRALPVVVLSHDRFTDTTCVDAERLHRSLLGFAHVAVFDKWAAFRLTDSLGKSLSCFNGCIRIYWPGLTRTSDPMHHELYFPVQIEKFEFSGSRLTVGSSTFWPRFPPSVSPKVRSFGRSKLASMVNAWPKRTSPLADSARSPGRKDVAGSQGNARTGHRRE